MRVVKKVWIAGVVALLLFGCINIEQEITEGTKGRKIIAMPGLASDAAFSSGVVIGNTLYCSGTIGINPETGELGSGIAEQTRFALDNVQSLLESEDFTLKDIVTVNVYLANLDDYNDMNDAYRSYFPGEAGDRPARATVEVAGLVRGALIEISCIAVKSD